MTDIDHLIMGILQQFKIFGIWVDKGSQYGFTWVQNLKYTHVNTRPLVFIFFYSNNKAK